MGWDHHGGLVEAINGQCHDTDWPKAALLDHLGQWGLFDDTLVVGGPSSATRSIPRMRTPKRTTVVIIIPAASRCCWGAA